MMMLELDYMASFNDPYTDPDDTTLPYKTATIFLLVVFVLIMPILLMNLLVSSMNTLKFYMCFRLSSTINSARCLGRIRSLS